MTKEKLIELNNKLVFIDHSHSVGVVRNLLEIDKLEKELKTPNIESKRVKKIHSLIKSYNKLNDDLDKSYIKAYKSIIDQMPGKYTIKMQRETNYE